MSEAEKAGQQQALQKEQSGLLEEPLRGSCETLETEEPRLSEAVEAEEKGTKEADPL